MNYLRDLAAPPAPKRQATGLQSQPLTPTQVRNSDGAYVFQASDWDRLARFLILGSADGSFYASERKLTLENTGVLARCVEADAVKVAAMAHNVSVDGRAAKQQPALYALAAACSAANDDRARRIALSYVPEVCRTASTLMTFLQYAKQFRGWGRGLASTVADWYESKTAGELAMQMVKYRNRDGYTHRDVLRLAHPKPTTVEHQVLYRWALGKDVTQDEAALHPELLTGFRMAQLAMTPRDTARIVRHYNLPREAVKPEHLDSREVWEALLMPSVASRGMPVTALIRNLGNMTKVGLLERGSSAAAHVASVLTNPEILTRSRVHPFNVLVALYTYASGQSVRGSGQWDPVPEVVDALDAAFYLAFGNVPQTSTRMMLALDLSASMTWTTLMGVPNMTPRAAAAAMSLITAASAPRSQIVGFSQGLRPLDITPRRRMDDVLRYLDGQPAGGTDCSLPMRHAQQHGIGIDTFVVYTDSETNSYSQAQPVVALHQYRQATGIDARLAVVGMVSNGFTLADPDDAGMLDVVGFDTAVPEVLRAFSEREF